MSQGDTDSLVSLLGAQLDYLMEFTADFGGDTSDYLVLAEGEDVDPQALTAAETGDGLRQFIEAGSHMITSARAVRSVPSTSGAHQLT
jgi:hypothetical protein